MRAADSGQIVHVQVAKPHDPPLPRGCVLDHAPGDFPKRTARNTREVRAGVKNARGLGFGAPASRTWKLAAPDPFASLLKSCKDEGVAPRPDAIGASGSVAQPVGGRAEALASRAHERSRSSPKSPQVTLALALCGSAAAYVAPAAKSAGVAMSASKADMADLAEANPDFLGSSLGLWDPLGAFPRPPRSGPPPAARVPPLTPSLP
jgi:hypothetical protein